MHLVWIALRSAVRRHGVALAGIALIVTVGTGVTLTAFIAAHRTATAHGDYVATAQVADLQINPDIATTAIDEAMRNLPGVEAIHSDSLFFGSVNTLEPIAVSEISSDPDVMLQVRGSTDGHYIDGDRPAISEGRFATGTSEVFVTDDERAVLEAQRGHPIEVGDQLDVAFWSAAIDEPSLPPDTIVSPIGVERLRIAGFGRLGDELLPDDLYARQRLIVSADVARKYTCEADLRADMTAEDAYATVFPETCSRSHRIYSLRLRPGVTSTDIQASFDEAAERLDAQIPPELAEQGVRYVFNGTDLTALNAAVRKVTRPTVASLIVFGVVTGLATVAVAMLAIWRLLRRDDDAQQVLRAIGATRGMRARHLTVTPVVAALVGIVVAVPLAYAASVIGPVGTVRVVDPTPDPSLPIALSAGVVALMAVVLIGLTAVIGRTEAGRTASVRRPRKASPGPVRAVTSGSPAVGQGVRAALTTRGSSGGAIVLVGAVVVIAAITTAVVFGTNLSGLVAQPAEYGWPWDAAVVTNGGYRSTDPAKASAFLDADDAVDHYDFYAFDPAVPIDGRPTPAVFGFPGAERTDFVVTEGRGPRRAGEALIGTATARELDVSVGDELPVDTMYSDRDRATVVGIGLVPAVGLFLAERPALGTGMVVLVDGDPTQPLADDFPAGMTAISLVDGADGDEFLDRLRAAPTWDAAGLPGYATLATSRPVDIVNADSMRKGPLLLAAVLAAGLTMGLALSIVVSVRDRRRELAILRALGFDRRALRITIAVQAITTIVIGLVVGLPLGALGGRVAWRSFADQLDVPFPATVPVGWLAVVAASAVAVAVLAAALPARAATHIRAAAEINAHA